MVLTTASEEISHFFPVSSRITEQQSWYSYLVPWSETPKFLLDREAHSTTELLGYTLGTRRLLGDSELSHLSLPQFTTAVMKSHGNTKVSFIPRTAWVAISLLFSSSFTYVVATFTKEEIRSREEKLQCLDRGTMVTVSYTFLSTCGVLNWSQIKGKQTPENLVLTQHVTKSNAFIFSNPTT